MTPSGRRLGADLLDPFEGRAGGAIAIVIAPAVATAFAVCDQQDGSAAQRIAGKASCQS